MHNVFVSTTCLKDNKDLFHVLDMYRNLGINKIELGSTHSYIEDFKPLFNFHKEHNTEFILHGYFPPMKEPFWVNLASKNEAILTKSKQLTRDAVDMCRKLESTLYSCHAGYTCDFDYSFKPITKMISESEAYDILRINIGELCDYAAQYNVNIAIENMNATHPFVLFNKLEEFENFFNMMDSKNLGVLLDIGHLKVASNLLNFDKTVFIKKLSSKLMEIHSHDNHAQKDDHLILTNSHAFDDFDDLGTIPVTLESIKLEPEQVRRAVDFLENINFK